MIAALALVSQPIAVHAQVLAQQEQGGTATAGSQSGTNNSGSNSNTTNSTGNNSSNSYTYGTYQGVDIGGGNATSDSAMTADRTGNQTDQTLRLETVGSKIKRPVEPGEFEKYVEAAVGRKIQRYGFNLMTDPVRDFAVPAQSTVPPDYALNIGDTISVALTGSVEGSADFVIDTDGRINIPKVGPVALVGVRYRDLRDRIAAAIGRQYRGYEVSVAIKKLRGVRVYVTGFANNPGAFSVNSLSTLVNALMAAGGPSAGGSYRSIQLIRNGRKVADFDLYDLLRRGDRTQDPILHNEDVIFVEPVGRQVAIIGSVNEEAIYEAKAGETLAELLGFAGGTNALGDKSRAIVYSLSDKEELGSREISADQAHASQVAGGDIIQVLSKGSLLQPLERQQVMVRIEGEVNKPGNYYVAPGTPLDSVLQMAGGLSAKAYPYGAKLTRLSVMAQQREAFRQAIDQFEMQLDSAPLNPGQFAATDEAAQRTAARQIIDRLRKNQPDGRLVLPIQFGDNSLPGDLALENNDRLYIPPRLPTAGVFGAVYQPASFLFKPGSKEKIKDLVERAGGVQAAADKGHIFVVRASGEVLTRKRGAMNSPVQPGDVVFVPVKTHSSSLLAKLTAISQMIFSLGLTTAAVAALP